MTMDLNESLCYIVNTKLQSHVLDHNIDDFKISLNKSDFISFWQCPGGTDLEVGIEGSTCICSRCLEIITVFDLGI